MYVRMCRMPELFDSLHPTGPGHFGVAERGITALLNPHRLRRVFSRMLDENEFLSPYGIRSLSRYHAEHPYIINVAGNEYRCGLSASRVEHRYVRGQLQLARSDLDAR
jgi:hypothetical protein